jgi:hypothetical protein
MLRADTTASVFDDEEKRARATTQVHKVAREGYRSDAGGSASWAGCDRTTTLVAGARHVQTSSLSARDVPTQPRRFAPSCGPSGRLHAPKSREAMPLVCLSDLGNGPTLDDLAMGSGSEFSLRRSRTACCADFVLYGSGTTRGIPDPGVRALLREDWDKPQAASHLASFAALESPRLSCRRGSCVCLLCAYKQTGRPWLPKNRPVNIGRDDWIRTSDPLTPSQVRYQAALHPVFHFSPP